MELAECQNLGCARARVCVCNARWERFCVVARTFLAISTYLGNYPISKLRISIQYTLYYLTHYEQLKQDIIAYRDVTMPLHTPQT